MVKFKGYCVPTEQDELFEEQSVNWRDEAESPLLRNLSTGQKMRAIWDSTTSRSSVAWGQNSHVEPGFVKKDAFSQGTAGKQESAAPCAERLTSSSLCPSQAVREELRNGHGSHGDGAKLGRTICRPLRTSDA